MTDTKRSLAEDVQDWVLDIAQECGPKYWSLQDGSQARVTWMGPDGLVALEHMETGHRAEFRVHVKAVPLPPLGPEDDGAWQAELAAEEEAVREMVYTGHPGPAAVLKVVEEARKDHRGGCAPEWCGGSGLDPCSLFNALERLERVMVEESGGQEEPHHWEPSSWEHVKPGDRVRLGTAEAVVSSAIRLNWHVDPLSSEYRPQPLETATMQVVLEGYNDGKPYTMKPSGPVDIYRAALPDWAAHAFAALAGAGTDPERVMEKEAARNG
jgi:hypothetical protein